MLLTVSFEGFRVSSLDDKVRSEIVIRSNLIRQYAINLKS